MRSLAGSLRRVGQLAGAVSLLAAATGSQARAQSVQGFADNRFEPAGAGSEWRTLESLRFDGHLRPALALVQNWAWKPLVAYDPQGSETGALIRHQLISHLDAAVMLWDRARFDIGLPLALGQTGSATDIDGLTYAAPQGYGVGDLRVGGDVRVFHLAAGAIRGAVGLQLFLPTGQTQAFSSDGGFRVWPRVLLAGGRGKLEWAARLGVHIRPTDDCRCNLAPGSEFTGALAAGWRITPRVLVGPEIYGSTTLSGGPFASHAATPIEMLIGGQVLVAQGWSAAFGVARGLTAGAGSPAVRMLVGAQYAFATGWGARPARPAPANSPPSWGGEPAVIEPAPSSSDSIPADPAPVIDPPAPESRP
jgi:OmpA-OmpF porin, OOP family